MNPARHAGARPAAHGEGDFPMHVGLNLLPVLPEVTGGWTYVHSLLQGLAGHAERARVRFTAFVSDASADVVPAHEAFTVVRVPVPARRRTSRIAVEHAVLPVLAARHRVDLMHHLGAALPLTELRPSVVTIYDLLLFSSPHLVGPVKRAYLYAMIRRAARRADVVAAISQATAIDLQRELGVPDERLAVVPCAVPDHFAPRPPAAVEAFRARYGLPPRFWLMVAEPSPHKNFERLFAAYAAFRARGVNDWPLVLRTRSTPELQGWIRDAGIGEHVTLLPRLADEEMPVLYSAAAAIVFPSLSEGGGLPLLEAMACGCPALASDIPTTREFAEGAARVFDPLDTAAIEAALADMGREGPLREQSRAAGLERAARMRIPLVGERCLEAYRRAWARGRAGRAAARTDLALEPPAKD